MIVEECVHAYSSSYTSLSGSSVWQTLGMDTEIVDTGGYHDNATNNSRITFPSGGVFLVMGGSHWDNPGFNVVGRLAKNGTTTGYEYTTDGFAAGPTNLSGPIEFWLENFSAGDYMESQTWNDGGGTHNARTQMCALRVSDYSCMVGDTGSSSASPVTFGTTIYDPHGMATTSTKLTAQKAGYYLVLSNINSGAASYISSSIRKNGSGVMNGSWGEGRSPADFAADWFEVGDYVEVINADTKYQRQFAMIYLGGTDAAISYTYSATDRSNSEAAFITGVLRTDTEWIDTGHGHPQHGFSYNIGPDYCISCGSFNMTAGYHFALAKISTDGGTFLQNDGVYTVLNGTQLGNVFSNNRHERGSKNTTVAFSCFQAADGDTFTGNWLASGTYVEAAYTPYTNVFVTDAAEGGGQIYRRL